MRNYINMPVLLLLAFYVEKVSRSLNDHFSAAAVQKEPEKASVNQKIHNVMLWEILLRNRAESRIYLFC